jgi:hypothetical protein
MDMLELEGMNMVEEQDHPTNHRQGEEDIHMVGIHMVEVESMDTVEEHYHPMNHRPDVEGMDREEEHYHPINHWLEVEGMDKEDSGMGQDMMVDLEVAETKPEGMVLVRHWTDDGAVRHRQAHREWKELVRSGYSEGQPMFASQDSNYYSSWRRV